MASIQHVSHQIPADDVGIEVGGDVHRPSQEHLGGEIELVR